MPLTVILEDIRSTYNVGAIMRTLDAVGGDRIICTGITPYPEIEGDDRSPVVISSNTKAIGKTALGAERSLEMRHAATVPEALARLAPGTTIVALEQSATSTDLFTYTPPPGPLALILGSETEGVSSVARALTEATLEIPQYGQKESLNVSVAAGIALYHLRRAQP